MITIVKFKDSDMEHMMNMIYNRDLSSKLAEDLPEHGYIAFLNMAPVAIGFLRMCEGNVAMIDSLITNPAIESEIRHVAIEGIVEGLIEDARYSGVKKLLTFTIDDGIVKRAKSFGFSAQPHLLLARELGDK